MNILIINRWAIHKDGCLHDLDGYVKQVYDLDPYDLVVIRGTSLYLVKDNKHNLAGKYIDSRLFKLFYPTERIQI